jgi:antitoxin (DNA-binding transcriptional repressor) of toxin-antitoxin stability system
MGSASATVRAGKSSIPSIKKGAPKTATVTVGELRTNFKAVEAKLAKGVRVQVTRRGAVVAEVVPLVEGSSAARPVPRVRFVDRLPEIEATLKEIWGDEPVDIDTTALVMETRHRDLLSWYESAG